MNILKKEKKKVSKYQKASHSIQFNIHWAPTTCELYEDK